MEKLSLDKQIKELLNIICPKWIIIEAFNINEYIDFEINNGRVYINGSVLYPDDHFFRISKWNMRDKEYLKFKLEEALLLDV
jgi:hypothetical protein